MFPWALCTSSVFILDWILSYHILQESSCFSVFGILKKLKWDLTLLIRCLIHAFVSYFLPIWILSHNYDSLSTAKFFFLNANSVSQSMCIAQFGKEFESESLICE